MEIYGFSELFTSAGASKYSGVGVPIFTKFVGELKKTAFNSHIASDNTRKLDSGFFSNNLQGYFRDSVGKIIEGGFGLSNSRH